MNNWREKYIGSKAFYMHVLGIGVPIIIQNLITNFVSLLDNIMVGQVGTLQMSGVSIVNQFLFVFNITIFGAVSGASIFGTQFFGKKDWEGQKNTFKYRIFMCIFMILIGMGIFHFFGGNLISLFLSKDDSPEMIEAALGYGQEYLRIMIWTLIPWGIGQAYTSVVRECGETRIPMYGSMMAIGINLILDYGLIFGKFGFPQMGVTGAAIATLCAKIVEALVVIIWAHTHPDRNPYMSNLWNKFFYLPKDLVVKIVIKSFPLTMNEFIWATGVAMVAQCYSVKGIEVVAARNIAMTLSNLFTVIHVDLGMAVGIIVGSMLGASQFKEAKDTVRKVVPFIILVTTVLAILLIPLAYLFPQLYHTEEQIKALACFYIIVQALTLPFDGYANVAYFVLRSGGKIGITLLFDSCFTCLIQIPCAFVLTRFVDMDIHVILVLVTYTIALKDVVGYFLIRSEMWVNNIVNE